MDSKRSRNFPHDLFYPLMMNDDFHFSNFFHFNCKLCSTTWSFMLYMYFKKSVGGRFSTLSRRVIWSLTQTLRIALSLEKGSSSKLIWPKTTSHSLRQCISTCITISLSLSLSLLFVYVNIAPRAWIRVSTSFLSLASVQAPVRSIYTLNPNFFNSGCFCFVNLVLWP